MAYQSTSERLMMRDQSRKVEMMCTEHRHLRRNLRGFLQSTEEKISIQINYSAAVNNITCARIHAEIMSLLTTPHWMTMRYMYHYIQPRSGSGLVSDFKLGWGSAGFGLNSALLF